MSLFSDLQTLVADRLDSDAVFSAPPAIPILTEQIGDLDNEIQRAIQRVGLVAIVLTPRVTRLDRRHLAEVEVVISVAQVRELSLRAGSKKLAADVAASAWALLDDWAASETWQPLIAQSLLLVEVSPATVYEFTAKTAVLLTKT